MKPRLSIVEGDGKPRELVLDATGVVTLGRKRGHSIVLSDRHASRDHAELHFFDGQWILRDLGTLNGTRLNGHRIQGEVPLDDGAEITIGDTRLVLVLTEGKVPSVRPTPATDPHDSDGFGSTTTPWHEDELTALCNFMGQSLKETAPRSLITRALQTLYRQTGAAIVGFLSLDETNPLPRVVLPELAQVDIQLSRELTTRVQGDTPLYWVGGHGSDQLQSDSLLAFRDAICVALRAEGVTLGALHIYQAGKPFGERHVRFCEVVAGYLASSLHLLQTRRNLTAENLRLRERAPSAANEEILGQSEAIQRLRTQISRLAPHNNIVLIQGESGVGKELVATAIHSESQRADAPLIVVNCAAIAASMPEAELFGHAKGSFTGADRDRPGFFQQADEGTLFLDEIGELSLEIQAKLLRVLDGKGFWPVGGANEVHVDVRVLAATNRDLELEVREGRFRSDLYYRLGIPIRVPSLREHPEDILILAENFLRKLGKRYHRALRLSTDAQHKLAAFSWPGNVRQLWMVLEYVAVHGDSDLIRAADLPLRASPGSGSTPQSDAIEELNLARLEERAIREAMRRTGNVIKDAAKLLGVHRDTLASKLKRLEENGES